MLDKAVLYEEGGLHVSARMRDAYAAINEWFVMWVERRKHYN
jgi:hypothetical protein